MQRIHLLLNLLFSDSMPTKPGLNEPLMCLIPGTQIILWSDDYKRVKSVLSFCKEGKMLLASSSIDTLCAG